jgi:hypothetical protein
VSVRTWIARSSLSCPLTFLLVSSNDLHMRIELNSAVVSDRLYTNGPERCIQELAIGMVFLKRSGPEGQKITGVPLTVREAVLHARPTVCHSAQSASVGCFRLGRRPIQAHSGAGCPDIGLLDTSGPATTGVVSLYPARQDPAPGVDSLTSLRAVTCRLGQWADAGCCSRRRGCFVASVMGLNDVRLSDTEGRLVRSTGVPSGRLKHG